MNSPFTREQVSAALRAVLSPEQEHETGNAVGGMLRPAYPLAVQPRFPPNAQSRQHCSKAIWHIGWLEASYDARSAPSDVSPKGPSIAGAEHLSLAVITAVQHTQRKLQLLLSSLPCFKHGWRYDRQHFGENRVQGQGESC